MYHEPVLLEEIIKEMGVKSGKNIVDCNLGGGGHAAQMLEKTGPTGMLIGIDLDADAIAHAGEILEKFGDRVLIVQENFSDIEEIVTQADMGSIDIVLFDLGLSKYHLEGSGRGFTFNMEEPLEMSFAHNEPRKAADVLNTYDEVDLSRIFREYGELKNASRLARFIVERREATPFKMVSDLVEVAQKAHIQKFNKNENKYLSQVFQSLRIEVNNELEHLRKALIGAVKVLSKGGKVGVISYHSLEDRIVKHFFKDQSMDCVCPPRFPVCNCETVPTLSIQTKKPILPSEEEIQVNSKSRSAKLRIAQKI